MSDKRPDFVLIARQLFGDNGDGELDEQEVAWFGEGLYNQGRESMREERDAERCTQCDCFEVFIARLTKQRDEAVGLLKRYVVGLPRYPADCLDGETQSFLDGLVTP